MKKFFYKTLNGLFNLCNKVVLFCTKYPILIILLISAIVVSIIILLTYNNANVGGLLGRIFGWLKGSNDLDNIERANTIPKDREQALGEADKNGYAQHKVSELERSLNPFRDKTVVELPSGKKVKLPEGVKDTDVDTLIEAETEVIIVPRKESHKKLEQKIQKAESTANKTKDLLERLKKRDT